MKRFNRSLALSLAAAAGVLLTPVIASAHEHRELADGRYSVVVGFSTEPAYSGFMNGLDLRVSDNSMATPAADGGEPVGAPVEGLEETLQVEIIYGDQKMALPLEPRWRTPGAYDAWVVPTAAGDYSFHIWGTIGETAIDETFTPGPETFSSILDQSTIQFPQASASTSAPVFGSVADNDGRDWGTYGGAIAGLIAGAAGVFALGRRGRRSAQLAGFGD
jgi:hypothetical protein